MRDVDGGAVNRNMDNRQTQSSNAVLSSSLRLIRSHRRMRTVDVAAGMNMALRSYEHFESGAGRINLERIHRFAEVTNSDPHAILAALALGSPAFALRCADNKLATIIAVVLQEFDEEAGDAIIDLDARTIINAFTKTLKDLADQSVSKDAEAEAWLEQRRGRLRTPARQDGNGES
ncbi:MULTISPECIES: helix-turn-helix transcriptional regulator [Brevundimonas]|uniref:helix-turn-helix transcriptional regulator n=2 Tax=Brevundimonas TaxID=41275 RepID=UPI0004B5C87C|nr:helix-turn-helix transcriptional regulator [Brevundimonas diminuta]